MNKKIDQTWHQAIENRVSDITRYNRQLQIINSLEKNATANCFIPDLGMTLGQFAYYTYMHPKKDSVHLKKT